LPPEKPDPSSLPKKPKPDEPQFQPKIGFIDALIPGRKQKAIDEAATKYDLALRTWKDSIRKYILRAGQSKTFPEVKDWITLGRKQGGHSDRDATQGGTSWPGFAFT
jgi:hypothetical protein